jgi:hypothetical protein
MSDEILAKPKAAKGPDISTSIFGGVLEYDGAGHYPGLELLNLVFGCDDQQLLPTTPTVKIKRRALDFARKLVWDEDFKTHPDRQQVILNDDSEIALAALLECLQLEIPGSTKRPGWDRAHFFPYTKSLIHFDARMSKATKPWNHKVGIERRYMRGGGALAFKILRLDPDQERLTRNRFGFSSLYQGTDDGPLDRLVETMAAQSRSDEHAMEDRIEEKSKISNDELDDLFRDGVDRILQHNEVSAVTRIKALVNWTAIWFSIMQMVRSEQYIDPDKPALPLVVDCGAGNAQLRRASQRCLKEKLSNITEAVEKGRIEEFGENSELSNSRKNSIRSFFWATAATAKLLNSWRGRRHFNLGLNALETLVLAGVPKGSQMALDDFVHEWLFEKCHMLVARKGASDAGLLETFDASIFEDNEAKLTELLSAAGLLTEYSDATRMVGVTN